MKYIIDKHDLYLKQEEPIIVSLNDIVTISITPVGCHKPITGKVLEIGTYYIKIDASNQYESNVKSYRFKDILTMKVHI